MTNTSKQAILDDDTALPYEIYEIRAIAVIDGAKLPVAYVGIVPTGGIQQAVAELQRQDSSCDIVLRHCLAVAPSYSVQSMGWAPDQKRAEERRRQLIAEHPLVLNQLDESGRENSIYHLYLREHGLEAEDSESAIKKCAACGEVKGIDDFWPDFKAEDGLQMSCKACYKEQRKRARNRGA